MIYTVIKVKHEGRKQFPEALKSFTEKYKAEKYMKSVIEKDGIKEDDIWIEIGFAHKLHKDDILNNAHACHESEIVDKLYHIWLVESKRPVCGLITKSFISKENLDKFLDGIVTKSDVKEFFGVNEYLILECEVEK